MCYVWWYYGSKLLEPWNLNSSSTLLCILRNKTSNLLKVWHRWHDFSCEIQKLLTKMAMNSKTHTLHTVRKITLKRIIQCQLVRPFFLERPLYFTNPTFFMEKFWPSTYFLGKFQKNFKEGRFQLCFVVFSIEKL